MNTCAHIPLGEATVIYISVTQDKNLILNKLNIPKSPRLLGCFFFCPSKKIQDLCSHIMSSVSFLVSLRIPACLAPVLILKMPSCIFNNSNRDHCCPFFPYSQDFSLIVDIFPLFLKRITNIGCCVG